MLEVGAKLPVNSKAKPARRAEQLHLKGTSYHFPGTWPGQAKSNAKQFAIRKHITTSGIDRKMLAFRKVCLSKYQCPIWCTGILPAYSLPVHSEWSPVENTELEHALKRSEVGSVFLQARNEHWPFFTHLWSPEHGFCKMCLPVSSVCSLQAYIRILKYKEKTFSCFIHH